MGRAKLEIKKIENITNRCITFSKRRNGIIKKAHELSVLCDVDVALILFSPSGKVTNFSGNKRIEDVLWRYLSLPEHQRGDWMPYQELLQETLEHRNDPFSDQQESPRVKDLEREIYEVKHLLKDATARLRMYEAEPDLINSLHDLDYQEQILQAALSRVRARKRVLQEQYNLLPDVQPSEQVRIYEQPQDVNANGLAVGNPNHVQNWSFPLRDPQVQMIVNLPSRDDQRPEASTTMWAPPSELLSDDCGRYGNQVNPSSGLEGNGEGNGELRHPAGGQVNLPQWDENHATGNDSFQTEMARERAILELMFLSRFKP